MRAIVTGATGLLGRHIVRELRRRSWSVTAIVRAGSNCQPLEHLNVDFEVCDLGRDRLDPRVLQGANVVFHAAAAVSEWAPWSHFVANTIRPVETVCDAMAAAGCRRLVHVSTVGVYGRPPHDMVVSEDFEPAVNKSRNFYRRAKIESERIVWRRHAEKQLDVTVIRPAMVYGPGDQAMLSRIIGLLRQRKILFLGDPQVTLPLVHVHDVARATVLAAHSERSTGQAYNVVNPEKVTQEEFFNTIAALAGAPCVRRRLPYPVAYSAALAVESLARFCRFKQPPPFTRYRVFLFGYQRRYSIEKIRSSIGWEPRISFRPGIHAAARWHMAHERS
jgi:2-alkyl-3-oxoalkanoate reductase